MKEPRNHHYIFAHRVLPELFFRNPEQFIDALGEGGDDFLLDLWERVGEMEINSGIERFTSVDLKCEIKKLGDGTNVVLITLPVPEGITEAYFIAAIYRPAVRKILFIKKKVVIRFFTLEYGWNLDDSTRTVLCEWKKGGVYYNMGDGPEPTLQEFFKSVCTLIEADYDS